MRFFTFIILGLLSLTSVTLADEEIISLIDAFVDKMMEEQGIPGMNLAAVSGGQPFLAKGYGFADVETGRLVTNQTLFYVASTSKAFTATVLAKALSNHPNWSLDTKVKEILPDDFNMDNYWLTHQTTIRDLLSHRTGTPAGDYQWIMGEFLDRAELVRRARFAKTIYDFRSSYVYSNVWFTTAGYALTSINGKTWEETVRNDIFSPLGMTATTFWDQLTPQQLDNIAHPYYYQIMQLKPVSLEAFSGAYAAGPSGSITSNAEDMQKWLLMHTNHGRNQQGIQVVNETDLRETYKAQLPFPSPNHDTVKPATPVTFVTDSYGLGWNTGYYREYQVVSHGGFWNNYLSEVTVLPDAGIAVYSSCTLDTCNHHHLHMYVIDLLLGVEPWVNTTYPRARDNGRMRSDTDKLRKQEPSGRSSSLLRKSLKSLKVEKNAKFEDDVRVDTEATKLNSHDVDLVKSHSVLADNLTMYEGTYGNYGLGNVTVYYNSTWDRLQGFYGISGFVNMLPNDLSQHTFYIKLYGPHAHLTPVPLPGIQFGFNEGSTITIDYLDITLPVTHDFPRFHRNRKIADAPPPNTDPCGKY